MYFSASRNCVAFGMCRLTFHGSTRDPITKPIGRDHQRVNHDEQRCQTRIEAELHVVIDGLSNATPAHEPEDGPGTKVGIPTQHHVTRKHSLGLTPERPYL